MYCSSKQRLSTWTGTERAAQGLFGSFLFNNNQRTLSAQPKCSKSRMPRPPSSLGRLTLGHAIKQCPPLATFLPLRRKFRRILSTAFKHQGGRSIAVAIWISIEVRTCCTSVALPAQIMSSAFHPGNLSAILSIYGCSCPLVSFLMERGRPIYLHGNSWMSQGRWAWTIAMSSAEQRHITFFCILVLRLVEEPNKCNRSTTIHKSEATGQRNKTTSSAYKKTRWWILRVASGCSSPSLLAFSNKQFRMFITGINSMGNRGSPCLRPRQWYRTTLEIPLRSTRVEEERSNPLIKSPTSRTKTSLLQHL